ncbi:FecR family protein [Bacteroides sp. 519]|uniref:FecR family protein n=1 Tax=Bacteroides sp. 519 TaxID=2302937 RepID=UPI0013D419C4|nr:FecR domain-containing protein [Bacteroides sp. 519]NDV57207.1 DUF4974 domain-containing protein [Bacteroides sp. 519]
MKHTDEDLDKLIEKLATATHSPKGKYTADESYKILQKTLFPKKRSYRLLRIAVSAAAVVLLCIAGWSVYNHRQPVNMIIESTLAETKTILLPDGSEVVLNRFTTLQYPEKFKEGERRVSLTGEAYFEVARNEQQPFIVETGHVNVKVLGTQFNVEAYANDPEVKTTLLEGSVAVYNNFTEQIILKPNESATYNKEQKKLTLNNEEDATSEIVWRDGSLIFSNITLAEITRRLSNHFGVTISIENPELETFKMTGRFVDKEPLEDVLDLLKAVGEFDYQKTEPNKIIIY